MYSQKINYLKISKKEIFLKSLKLIIMKKLLHALIFWNIFWNKSKVANNYN